MLANHFHEPPRRVVTFTTSAKALIVLTICQLVLSFIAFITGITFLHRSLHPDLDKKETTTQDPRRHDDEPRITEPNVKSSPATNIDQLNIADKMFVFRDRDMHGGGVVEAAREIADANFGASLILLGLGGMLAGGLGLGGSLLGNKAMVLVHHVAAMFVAYLSTSVCIACNIYADAFARKLPVVPDYGMGDRMGVVTPQYSTYGEWFMELRPWYVVIPSMNLVVSLLLAIFTFASSLVVCNMFADGITEPTPCCHVTIAAAAGPCQGPMVAPCPTGARPPPPTGQQVRSRNKPASVEIRVRTDDPASHTSRASGGSGSGSGAMSK